MSHEINNAKPERAYVFKTKLSINYTISHLKKNIKDDTTSLSKEYNYNDYLNLLNKYKKDTLVEEWSKSDFQGINCAIISNDINDLKMNYSQDIFKGNRLFFAFSNPLFIDNRKKVLFYASKAKGFGSVLFSGIIIMKKNNKKWKLIEQIESKELY